MKLAFIYGDPATGKYTIGRELARITGWELYHNHLVVDEVLTLHAFGTPGFVRLRDERWRNHFASTAAAGQPNLIFTFNPENTVPQEFIDWIFHELPRRGVAIYSVELAVSEAAIEARLGTKQRQGFKKLTDLGLYRQLRAAGTFLSPVIPRTDLHINTEAVSPTAAAGLIARLILS
jgi:hypothetical protein